MWGILKFTYFDPDNYSHLTSHYKDYYIFQIYANFCNKKLNKIGYQ